MIKGIIFDLDGTTLDTVGDINLALNKTLGSHFTDRECDTFVGNGLKNCMKAAMEKLNLPPDNLDENFKKLVENYKLCPVKYSHPYKGVPEFLKELNKRGIKIGIFSNKEHELAVTVVKTCFPGIEFDFICGRNWKYPAKPDPAAVLAFADICGCSKDGIIYVGDSEVDNRCAEDAGVRHFILTWGTRPKEVLLEKGVNPEIMIADMTELKEKAGL